LLERYRSPKPVSARMQRGPKVKASV